MLTNAGIWAAIDRLAARKKLTALALARRAGRHAAVFPVPPLQRSGDLAVRAGR